MNPVLCAIAVIVADLQPLATSGIILTKSVKLFAPHVTNQCWQWHRLIRGLLSRVLAKGETQVVAVTENPKTKSCYKDAVREETHRQTSQRDRPAGTREEVDKKTVGRNMGRQDGITKANHETIVPWWNSPLWQARRKGLEKKKETEEGEREGAGGARDRRALPKRAPPVTASATSLNLSAGVTGRCSAFPIIMTDLLSGWRRHAPLNNYWPRSCHLVSHQWPVPARQHRRGLLHHKF